MHDSFPSSALDNGAPSLNTAGGLYFQILKIPSVKNTQTRNTPTPENGTHTTVVDSTPPLSSADQLPAALAGAGRRRHRQAWWSLPGRRRDPPSTATASRPFLDPPLPTTTLLASLDAAVFAHPASPFPELIIVMTIDF